MLLTYIMLSTLTPEGVQTIKNNPTRIREVNREIEQLGATVKAQWAVLGQFDFVNVVEAPDEKTIARVSLELASRGTAKYETLVAIPIDDFGWRHLALTDVGGPSARLAARACSPAPAHGSTRASTRWRGPRARRRSSAVRRRRPSPLAGDDARLPRRPRAPQQGPHLPGRSTDGR